MNKKKQALLTILDTKAVYPVFQPIVDLETCQVVAYESLSRIGNKELYMNIEELFKVAEAYGYVWKLEKLCRDKALETSVNKPLETNINVNLKMYSFDHLRMYNIDHINTCCSRR